MGSRKTDQPDDLTIQKFELKLEEDEKKKAREVMWKKMQKESWNNLYELHKR